jgi:predicted DNA-binding transcriptional regulator
VTTRVSLLRGTRALYYTKTSSSGMYAYILFFILIEGPWEGRSMRNMKEELTDKQKTIYGFIKGFLIENHRTPTYDEIANHVGVVRKTAFDHVVALEHRGYLEIDRGITRGIKLKNISVEIRECNAAY